MDDDKWTVGSVWLDVDVFELFVVLSYDGEDVTTMTLVSDDGYLFKPGKTFKMYAASTSARASVRVA